MAAVRIKPTAFRELSEIEDSAQLAFNDAIGILERGSNPLRPVELLDIKQLRRSRNHWQLRVGR